VMSRGNHDLMGFGGPDNFQIAFWKDPRA